MSDDAIAEWEKRMEAHRNRTRKQIILDIVSDLVGAFTYYDRKESESLPMGALDEAIAAGEITVDEIVAQFRQGLEATYGAGVDPAKVERDACADRLRAIPIQELQSAGFQADTYHEAMRELFLRALDPDTKWNDDS